MSYNYLIKNWSPAGPLISFSIIVYNNRTTITNTSTARRYTTDVLERRCQQLLEEIGYYLTTKIKLIENVNENVISLHGMKIDGNDVMEMSCNILIIFMITSGY